MAGQGQLQGSDLLAGAVGGDPGDGIAALPAGITQAGHRRTCGCHAQESDPSRPRSNGGRQPGRRRRVRPGRCDLPSRPYPALLQRQQHGPAAAGAVDAPVAGAERVEVR